MELEIKRETERKEKEKKKIFFKIKYQEK